VWLVDVGHSNHAWFIVLDHKRLIVEVSTVDGSSTSTVNVATLQET
jgi:hypothetical protein